MISAQDLKGVLAIMPTPAKDGADRLDAVDTLDLDEPARLAESLVRDGATGIMALGTMGECATTSPSDYEAYVDCLLKTVRGRIPTFVGTATLSGTPAAGTTGTYALIFTATGSGPAATQNFTLTVSPRPTITSAASTTFTVGSPGTFTVTTTGSPTPSLAVSGSLPSGVTFLDNGNGTVTDTLTGLIWLKNANPFGFRTWDQALTDCNSLASGSYGLADDSRPGQWRLPNIKEIESLVDYGRVGPCLPEGHPFVDVRASIYWT